MHTVDWIILCVLFFALVSMGYLCKHLIKGVADFLVAGRSVGRYLGLGAGSLVGVGAASVLASWQMTYKSGFVGNWLWSTQFPLAIFIALSGFAIFRFRQTGAMTIPQMFEMRYGKGMRILGGILIFVSGVINMGVFPAIGARFFVYYCGLPQELNVLGLAIPTFVAVMLVIVGAAVFICFIGGQVTLILTDFFQNIFVNILLALLVIVVFKTINWSQFVSVYTAAPENRHLVVPFSGGESEFNAKFFLIQLFWMVYFVVTWAPETMQVSSAKDASEAKFMRAMVSFRVLAGMLLGLFIVPLAAYVLMNHPDFSSVAAKVNGMLAGMANPSEKSQLIVPTAISQILPAGLIGAFAAMMLFTSITQIDVFMLAWAGVLIQDVIIPIRGKKFEPKAHLVWLRAAVFAVAVIILLISTFFKMSDNIVMFMCLSGSLYTAGGGIVILGGLYWSKPTKLAAWITMLTGATVSLAGFIYRYKINTSFPLDGYDIGFATSVLCIVVYCLVSLLSKSKFDLTSMFRSEGFKGEDLGLSSVIRWSRELPRADKVLFWFMMLFTCIYLSVTILIAALQLAIGLPTNFWLGFWKYYLYSMFVFGTLFLLWTTFGGFNDLRKMFRSLREEKTNVNDDGTVQHGKNKQLETAETK